jgi:hypothetical protein
MDIQAQKEQTGRAGEFLAAYILENNGAECHRVDRRGSDLWVKLPNGKLVTVQVKTAAKALVPKKGKPEAKRSSYYRYHTGTLCNADWYIFVALDLELIRLMPAKEVTGAGVNMSPHSFNANAQANDIATFLSQSVGGSE